MLRYRYAFSLSKEEVKISTPPGTVHLIDNEIVRTQAGGHEYEEKHVNLQPEPSPDPADPLNWPIWRKFTVLALMSLYAAVGNISSAVLSSALPNMVTAFAVFSPYGPPTGIEPFDQLTHLAAVNILFLGASNIFWVPLSNTFGRRPVILIALAMLTGFSAWAASAKSFNSLLAARALQGIGGGPSETLCPDVVGRIFFVHQKGRAIAIYTVSLALGSIIGGTVGGYIAGNLGWRWTMWISTILAGAVFVVSVLFLPETLFDREAAMSRRVESHQSPDPLEEKNVPSKLESVNERTYPPYTFARSLGFVKPRRGLIKNFFTPYKTLLLPGTLMVMLHYAGLVGLVVTVSTVGPTLVAAPPYLWGNNVGLINVPGLIGTALGGVYTYLTTDWLIKRSAKRESHGFGEPETRLPLMFPTLASATFGALIFGLVAQNPSPKGWVGLSFGYGMIAFGLMQVPSVGFNYILESYGNLSADCLLMVVVLRSIIAFSWTFFVGTWSAKAGPAEPFGIFTLLMGVFSLSVLPLWAYGKRFRIATAPLVMRADPSSAQAER
ncbi:MAG: hypothetical protein M1820_002555 [Bogoriella megaspora]|nr:MAG: hypothetical protein M1820_002555 [Bogoriella megaspora]